MSRSHTKHYKPCINYCKKGNSKKNKILANKKFRNILKNRLNAFNIKGNYYRKFTRWWDVQGDYGRNPCSFKRRLVQCYEFASYYGNTVDLKKEWLDFLKYCYWK